MPSCIRLIFGAGTSTRRRNNSRSSTNQVHIFIPKSSDKTLVMTGVEMSQKCPRAIKIMQWCMANYFFPFLFEFTPTCSVSLIISFPSIVVTCGYGSVLDPPWLNASYELFPSSIPFSHVYRNWKINLLTW